MDENSNILFVIKPDNTVEEIPVRNGEATELEELQQLVGGYIETVSGPYHHIIAIVNEMGHLQGLEMNLLGSVFMHYYPIGREGLVGNVVIAMRKGENITGFSALAAAYMRVWLEERRKALLSIENTVEDSTGKGGLAPCC